MPGPSTYKPTSLLQKFKKVTIGLPPTVKIDLTPGVGDYNSNKVLPSSPQIKISTAPKTSIFVQPKH